MKLFIITIEEVWDFERMSHTPEVFLKKENASNRLSKLYDEYSQEYKEEFDKDYDEEVGEMMVEMWNNGSWSQTHFIAEIHEHELDDDSLSRLIK